MTTAFRSLRHRNARLFFGGLLVSNIGTWMQLTAMSLLVYRLTGRTTDLGVTVALQFLPMLVLGAWAGAVADRRDKRTMAMITQAALAVQALVLGILDLSGLINLPLVFLLSFVLGVINAFDNPARRGFVTELVTPDEIGDPRALTLRCTIRRRDDTIFDESVGLDRIKRSFEELIGYLRLNNPIQDGAVLSTGTGIIVPPELALQDGDLVTLECGPIGTLRHTMRRLPADWSPASA